MLVTFSNVASAILLVLGTLSLGTRLLRLVSETLRTRALLKKFDTYTMHSRLHLWDATPADGAQAVSTALRHACLKVKYKRDSILGISLRSSGDDWLLIADTLPWMDGPQVQFGDKVFRFIAAGEADDILVIPPKYANELKGFPEKVLDFNAALREVGRCPFSFTWHRRYRRSLHRNGLTVLANAD
jgi:hypothetical protein